MKRKIFISCLILLALLGTISGLLLFRVYQQDKEINKLVEKNNKSEERINKILLIPSKPVEKRCEIRWRENIADDIFSYSKDDGFCDGSVISDYTWWTRSTIPTGEMGIKWSQDGVMELVLIYDNSTKIVHRALDPYYLAKQNLNFSEAVLNNRFYLISSEEQISPDGKYLVFSVHSCAGCGDGVFMDEIYLYNTVNDKVKSLGKFSSNQSRVIWIENNMLKIGEKIIKVSL